MRKQKFIFLLPIVSLFVIFQNCSNTNEHKDQAFFNCLGNATSPIKSTNPYDTNFEDLSFIKNLISDSVRIIMLGEESHGDGTTTLTKIRLIKYLHEKMGFDVLAFESGLYNCCKAWDEIKKGKNLSKEMFHSIFGCWTRTKQFQSLFTYMEQQYPQKPLELAGFDCQFTGEKDKRDIYFFNDFDKFISNINFDDISNAEQEECRKNIKLLIQYQKIDSTKYRKTIFFIKRILENLENDTNEVIFSDVNKMLMHQTLLNLLTLSNILIDRGEKKLLDFNRKITFNFRDEQNGQNLIWLSNVYRPNKKILVWAHNFHVIKNPSSIYLSNKNILNLKDYLFKEEFNKLITTGDVVYKELKNKVYIIGFTAYQGEWTNINNGSEVNIKLPSEGSLEDFLNRTGYENSFLDFNQLVKNCPGGSMSMESNIFNYQIISANWTNNLDAIIFNKVMEPSIRMNYKELNKYYINP